MGEFPLTRVLLVVLTVLGCYVYVQANSLKPNNVIMPVPIPPTPQTIQPVLERPKIMLLCIDNDHKITMQYREETQKKNKNCWRPK